MTSPKSVLDDAYAALVFFTRLPLPPRDTAARPLAEAIWAAPLAGLAVGVIAAIVYVVAAHLDLPSAVAAAVAIAASLLVTGALHEDGLSDTADGFGGGKTREAKLDIMRDSRIGAYGACAIALSILLRWSALAAVADSGFAMVALIAAHTASRALIPAFMQLTPPARSDGLSAGAGAVSSEAVFIAGAIGLVVLLLLGPLGAMITAFWLVLAFLAFRHLCMSQIGGQTGDTIGAMQQVGEITVLLSAAALLS